MNKYNPQDIEKKWRDYWHTNGTYRVEDTTDIPKQYVLDMFPYPSGAGLHVGHPKGYIATDIYSRYKRMQGFNVLHPMGWDAFGLPAENYAIKNKVHPRIAVEKNIEVFKSQLEKIGFNFDWSREIDTTDPAYYKWTQWCVAKMFEAGLMEEVYEPIIWCPECKTGLALEDLEDGKCERCGSEVEKKPLRQWVIKITKYADRLLADLEDLDWEEGIKEMQRHWIGRSEGLLFTAPVKDMDLTIQTFSAHFEACYADTFVVIAPDHPLLPTLVDGTANKDDILAEAAAMVQRRLAKGFTDGKEIEGIFTGRYIVDPLGNGDLPIWVASYALADYGTGIVKCSAHDERDFAFAKKYHIPIKAVLLPEDPTLREAVERLEVCFTDMKHGIVTAPTEVSGMNAHASRDAIMQHAIEQGFAEKKVTYKLRDWVFARQRYWGEPFPFIHKADGTVEVVPESQLPVELPLVDHYEPTGTGESPLAAIEAWVRTPDGKRETNTMPQWAGSSWYYLRYIDPHNADKLVDPQKEQYWMGDKGVDLYVGGLEHATRHLIYARFWHKFLYDIGVVSTSEPFQRLINVGLIMAEDGRKMSKRWGNVINPDDIIETYGADSFRMYEMFIGPFTQSASWNTRGVEGVHKFLQRYVRLYEKSLVDTEIEAQERLIHKAIKKVTGDIEQFSFNTAIAEMMIVVNELTKAETVRKSVLERFNRILAPFAVHITEELHHTVFGGTESVHHAAWPTYDEAKLVADTITVVVQINGKVRDELTLPADASKEDAEAAALASEKVQSWLDGKEVKKMIYVPRKLVSIVVS